MMRPIPANLRCPIAIAKRAPGRGVPDPWNSPARIEAEANAQMDLKVRTDL